MTKDAFNYAMAQLPLPQGGRLWLYGESYNDGDRYTPYCDKVSALQGRGQVFSNPADITGFYETVGLNAPKQQEETEGLLALAFSRAKNVVLAIARTDAGGNRLAKLFAAYGVTTHQLSKDHCKIVYTMEAQKADRTIIERDLALLTPHPVAMDGREWWTVPGLFGWNKIDPGSKLLAELLPANLTGRAADFGCGFGYLSAHLAQHAPGIVSIDAYDNDARAVAATARNITTKTTCHWQDIRTFEPKPIYDVVVMNPPFHSGKEEDIGLGESFIRKGWAALREGGQLFVVANRNLPYELIVKQLTTMHAGQGYKVMTGRK